MNKTQQTEKTEKIEKTEKTEKTSLLDQMDAFVLKEEINRLELEKELQANNLAAQISQKRSRFLRSIILYFSTLASAIFIYVGATGNQWIDFAYKNSNIIIGLVIGFIGLSTFIYMNNTKEADFTDVDQRRKVQRAQEPIAAWPFPTSTRPEEIEDELSILAEMEKIRHEHASDLYQRELELELESASGYKNEKLGKDDSEKQKKQDHSGGIGQNQEEDEIDSTDKNNNKFDSNSQHKENSRKNIKGRLSGRNLVVDNSITTDALRKQFGEITKILVERAEDADEKASLLLSKGTNYTKGGISFFIISIVSWQILCAYRGFQTEFIYGMISSTGLFIFIEFLSAWFLKQYRQYIDTATYLLRVKSVFDKYLLLYLTHKSFNENLQTSRDAAAQSLINSLEKDFPWPDSYILKKETKGFADEAADAIHKTIKEMRKKQKNKRKYTNNGNENSN